MHDIITLDKINLYDIGNEIQVAGTLWTGKDLAFITFVPGKDEDLTYLKKMPLSLEDWQRLNRQSDIQETEMFLQDPTGITKVIVRKSQRQLDTYLQWACFKRDNYTCRYCGRDGIPLTVDHVDLWENGGAAVLENLVTACRSCNKDRGRTEYEVWILTKKYQQKAQGLSEAVKQQNILLVQQLPYLRSLRVSNVRSR